MIERNHKANPLDNQCRQKNDKPGRISQAWWKFRIYNLLGWDDGKGGFEVFNNLVKTEKATRADPNMYSANEKEVGIFSQ